MKEEGNLSGGVWRLYKTGGITPVITSLLGGQNAQQMAFIRSVMKQQRRLSLFDIPLTQLEFVVFDLETTGFKHQHGDEIISIGAVTVNGNQIQAGEPFYRIVNPLRKIPKEIVKLTGITNQMAETGQELITVLHDFFEFTQKRILIAHGTGHDKPFLNAALKKTSKVTLSHRLLDTMMIGKWLFPHWDDHHLDTLLVHFHIPVTLRHHALEDARMTAQLWACMLQEMETRQVITLGDLYAYLST